MTDFFFGFGEFSLWMFKHTLEPIAEFTDWILFAIGMVMMFWWIFKLIGFGIKNEKDYKGW